MAISNEAQPQHPGPNEAPPKIKSWPSKNAVQRTRAWTGLLVVVAGDVAIAVAAIWGIVKTGQAGTASASEVAILTSAFTAIGTMTTAYFGIKSMSNTAQSLGAGGSSPPATGDPTSPGGTPK